MYPVPVVVQAGFLFMYVRTLDAHCPLVDAVALEAVVDSIMWAFFGRLAMTGKWPTPERLELGIPNSPHSLHGSEGNKHN